MKRIESFWAIVLGGVVMTTGVQGVDSQDQMQYYQYIYERNAFGLKPIPPPPEPPKEVEQPVNIVFTGITSMLGVKKAFFKIPDAKNPSLSQFPCIQEGERDGVLEVISIDEIAGAVKVRNAGTPMTLTFEKHGNKAQMPSFAGTPGVPGAVPRVTPVIANPGIPQGVPPPPGALPNRTVNFNRPQSAIAAPNATTGLDPNVLRQIPSRQLRSLPSTPAAPANSAANEQALVQSLINVEINRELTKDKVAAGLMPPLPPTDLTDPSGAGPNFNLPVPSPHP